MEFVGSKRARGRGFCAKENPGKTADLPLEP
jgi:hypothetical protein